MVIKIL